MQGCFYSTVAVSPMVSHTVRAQPVTSSAALSVLISESSAWFGCVDRDGKDPTGWGITVRYSHLKASASVKVRFGFPPAHSTDAGSDGVSFSAQYSVFFPDSAVQQPHLKGCLSACTEYHSMCWYGFTCSATLRQCGALRGGVGKRRSSVRRGFLFEGRLSGMLPKILPPLHY